MPLLAVNWRLCAIRASSFRWYTASRSPPTARYLASGSRDGTVRIWTVPVGYEVARMSIERDPVNKVQFTPGDRYLVTSAQSTGVKLWLWRPEDLVAQACGRLMRNLTTDEWRQYLGSEGYRKTCPNLP
jgi:WD40 repeat protein